MGHAQLDRLEPVAPSPEEAKAAGEIVRRLMAASGDESLKIAFNGGTRVELPRVAVDLLIRLLQDLAAGHAVTLIPVHAEMTTQQAADLLGVSRPFLIKQLEEGKLSYRMVGSHRRILFKDLMEYKRTMDAARRDALQQLADDAQVHGLGYQA